MPFFSSQPKEAKKTEKKEPSRLVWHSNIGATRGLGRTPSFNKKRGVAKGLGKGGLGGGGYAFGAGYRSAGPKVVHFATIEVQPFNFDWSLAGDVWYTRQELNQMSAVRFDDAAYLRKQKGIDAGNNAEGAQGGADGTKGSRDDVDLIAKKSTPQSINALITHALSDPDTDPTCSIRGIEHFVYPELQQEMIRKKKLVQREVLEFVREHKKGKRPDPQGWRLAQHSRNHSQWARDVALEKGMRSVIDRDEEVILSTNDRAFSWDGQVENGAVEAIESMSDIPHPESENSAASLPVELSGTVGPLQVLRESQSFSPPSAKFSIHRSASLEECNKENIIVEGDDEERDAPEDSKKTDIVEGDSGDHIINSGSSLKSSSIDGSTLKAMPSDDVDISFDQVAGCSPSEN